MKFLCLTKPKPRKDGDGELDMYMGWSNADPPNEAEFVRNDRIREKQGNGNPFVEMFPRPD